MKTKLFLSIVLTAGTVFAGSCKTKAPCAPEPKCAPPAAKCAPCAPECWMQGDPLNGQYCPAYNAPAIWNVCGRQCCDNQAAFFAEASFLYWYGGEEGLQIASNGILNGGTLFFATQTTTSYQQFDYKPGFKVGVGYVGNHNWSTYAEYTWLRGTNDSSFSAPSTSTTAGTTPLTGTPVLVVGDWFLNGTPVLGQAFSATSIKSKWHYELDLIDLCASRPFYEGPRLTVNPYGGLRVALIRQDMTINLTQAVGSLASLPSQPISSHNSSHSWGIGPRFGADTYWLFCHGLRLEADLAASLLYTRYTKVSHSESRASTTFNPGPYGTSLEDYSCLRPMSELGLGLGWGTYLYGNSYHLDFSASYDFTYMWNQNMIRKLLDDTLTGTSPSSADLYFHGLTLQSRFDF